MRLFAAERRAAGERQRRGAVSRRAVVGGIGASVASLVWWAPPTAASVRGTRLSDDAWRRVQARGPVGKAVNRHGAVAPSLVREFDIDGMRVVSLQHSDGARTFLDAAGDPNLQISIVATVAGATKTLTFADENLEALGTLFQVGDGPVQAAVPEARPSPRRVECFIACLAGKVDQGCFNAAVECFATLSVMSCAYGIPCAGSAGLRCRKVC